MGTAFAANLRTAPVLPPPLYPLSACGPRRPDRPTRLVTAAQPPPDRLDTDGDAAGTVR
jgi:hypothetical protein